MITVLCCDDNAEQLEQLKTELKTLDVGEPMNPLFFTDSHEMMSYAEKHGSAVDVVLCDIVLDKENGVELAGLIKQRFPQIQVVFMSAFEGLFEETYHVEHIAFLKKPVKRDRLEISLKKAAAVAKVRREMYITVRVKGALMKLDISKILYVEAHLREVKIVTETEIVNSYNRLSDIGSMLDARFVNCHKSYIVNIDKISQICRLQFILKNGEIIPIAMARYDEVRQHYLTYLGAGL